MHIASSLAKDKTYNLWSGFMTRRKEIKNVIGNDFFSIQVYPADFEMKDFTPNTVFKKWAAIEVSSAEHIPTKMDLLIIPASTYAVFTHVGPASSFYLTANYIYSEWLPFSDFALDDQPHFEVMGDKYLGHENPNSEEEVWIPIKYLLK